MDNAQIYKLLDEYADYMASVPRDPRDGPRIHTTIPQLQQALQQIVTHLTNLGFQVIMSHSNRTWESNLPLPWTTVADAVQKINYVAPPAPMGQPRGKRYLYLHDDELLYFDAVER